MIESSARPLGPARRHLRPHRLVAPLTCAFLTFGLAEEGAFPFLEIVPETLDFGRLGTDEKKKMVLQIRNTGKADLEIDEIKSCCGIIQARLHANQRTIAPQKHTEVEVTLNSAWSNANIDKWIDLKTNAGPLRIPVRAIVHPGVRTEIVQPTSQSGGGKAYSLSPVLVGRGITKTVEFKLLAKKGFTGPIDLEGLEFFSMVARKAVRNRNVRLRREILTEKERGYKIALTFLPGIAAGRFQGQVRGKLNGYQWIYRVSGEVFQGILPEPNGFSFQAIENPGLQPSEITLTSTDGLGFEILEITAIPPRFYFQHEPNATGTVHKITAHVLPAEPGNRITAKIRIRTTHPAKEVLELTARGFFRESRP